jgi:phospholipid/cholesterol/gamma-HCH transport system substrate-binding protein
MNKLISPFRVGLFTLILGATFVVLYSYVHKGGLSDKEAIGVYAIFHDASGLDKKSKVMIAGIQVGDITDIELANGNLAKITLRIRRTVHLKTDAALSKRSESLLGDNLLDVYAGSPDSPDMPEGGEIKTVNDKNGMQEIFDSLGRITKDIEGVTKTLGGTLNTQEGSISDIMKSLQATIDRAGTTINDTLDNVHAISEQMSGVVGSEQRNIEDIVDNVRAASQEAAAALKIVDKVLGANQGEMTSDVASLKDALDKLNKSLENIQQVTDKVNNGSGTLSKLVNDDGVYRKLDDTLTDASDFVARLLKIQTQVQLHGDYLIGESAAKGYLDLRLVTRPDRYYLLQLVDDNRATTTASFNTCNPCSPLETTGVTTTTSFSLKYSAEIAQKFFDLATLRLGIIESTAGGGLDVDLWKPYLMVTGDLFDFTDYYQPYPRLRAYFTGRLFNHLEIRAGVDDILNNWAKPNSVAPLARGYSLGGRDVFVGGGIYFTDDDLKAVIGVAPTPK